jgi:hypothetical protein
VLWLEKFTEPCPWRQLLRRLQDIQQFLATRDDSGQSRLPVIHY